MIRQSKEREAREKAKEKEKEIARNKGGALGSKGGIGSMPSSEMPGISSAGPVTIPSGAGIDSSMGMGGMGGMGMDRPPTYQKPLAKGTGMALGKKTMGGGAMVDGRRPYRTFRWPLQTAARRRQKLRGGAVDEFMVVGTRAVKVVRGTE